MLLPEWWALLGFYSLTMMFHRLSRCVESSAFSKSMKWVYKVAFHWLNCSSIFLRVKMWLMVLLFPESLPAPSSRCCQRLFWFYLSTLCQRSYLWLVKVWYPSSLYTRVSCPSWVLCYQCFVQAFRCCVLFLNFVEQLLPTPLFSLSNLFLEVLQLRYRVQLLPTFRGCYYIFHLCWFKLISFPDLLWLRPQEIWERD